MLKEIKKIWLDTCTNPKTGKYSQKRLMNWIAFDTAILLCLVSVFEISTDPKFDFSTTKPDLGIIATLFVVAGFTVLATLLGGFLNRKVFSNGFPLKEADEEETKEEKYE